MELIDLRSFKEGAYLGGVGAGLYAGRCPHCGEIGAIIQKTARSSTGYWAHEIIGATDTTDPDARPCPAGLKTMSNGTVRPRLVKLPKREPEQSKLFRDDV